MIYRFAQCELDTELVELRKNGQQIAVEPQVFRLLQLLLEKNQQVLSKNEILATIWRNRVVSESSLSSCIKAARQAIGDSGDEQNLIRTLRGRGFRFVAELTSIERTHSSTAVPVIKSSSTNGSTFIFSNGPLTGRQTELDVFKTQLATCLNGYAQVTLLSGSAGIGKSRLLEETAQLAMQYNMSILWGNCREESGAPAYWPWRQLLIAQFKAQTSVAAQEAPELARLFPELFGQQNKQIQESKQNAEQVRFKVFHSIALLLSRTAAQQPLFLVFDDLHRADQASLTLLEFICAELAHYPVFIMGTYRDTELNHGHRFFQTLSELSRLAHFRGLQLGHLTKVELELWLAQSLPSASAITIHNIIVRTDGHPLYVSETIRHLQQGGDPDTLPLSLKAIISQRFIHLPTATVEVLRAASVIGRRFELATVASILAQPLHKVLVSLDQAVVSGQLSALEHPGHYQFSHILIRETLYDSLLNSDRLHLHCNLAEYLEQQQAESGVLAFHYHQAAPMGMAEKATYFAQQAAQEASLMLAYEITARYYQQALQTASLEQKLGLTLALGQAQVKGGESIQAITTFEKAAKLAEQSQHYVSYAHAAIGMEEALWRPGLIGNKALKILYKALGKLALDDVKNRLAVICALMRAQMMCGMVNKDLNLLQQAKEYAAHINDPGVHARLLLAELYTSLLQVRSPELFAKRIKQAKAAADLAKKMGNDSLYIEVLTWQLQDMFVSGDISEIDALLNEQIQSGLATKQPFFQYYSVLWRSLFSAAKGEFALAEQHANKALDLCRWLPGQDGEGVYGLQMFTIKREQGALLGMSHVVQQFVQTTPQHGHWKPGLALIYAELGQFEQAKPLFYSLVAADLKNLPKDAMWLTCVVYLSEVCAKLQDVQYAELLYQALLPCQGFNILVGANICTLGSTDRYLGLLAMTLLDWHVAEQHFKVAISKNDEWGFPVYSAHSRYELALLMSKRKAAGDKHQAQDLLDLVLKFAQQKHMHGLSQQALSLRQKLRSGEDVEAGDQWGLSKREREVLRLIVAGKQNKEIAQQLYISANTVAAHIRNILDKTATSNRTQASNFAVQHRILHNKD